MEAVMSLPREYDDENYSFTEYSYDEEDVDQLSHKKRVRKMLEEKLERKRLREELEEEWDSDFDWDDIER
ncbi:hypothetical protein [Legionella tunisiensis]|uniref:hypothetical protein n=1 Tax=Legionella tunisiensis TaxID=1034944 RepID=UPI001E2DC3F8|nr:hypothetical protein [Legionella tunisiensis]